jgi:hypothetical protein
MSRLRMEELLCTGGTQCIQCIELVIRSVYYTECLDWRECCVSACWLGVYFMKLKSTLKPTVCCSEGLDQGLGMQTLRGPQLLNTFSL